MNHTTRKLFAGTFALLTTLSVANASTCKDLPSYEVFKEALIKARQADNGGFNFEMWGSLVDRSGVICAVAYTGTATGDQWLGSRVISAQKANTAIAFNLPGFALSTSNLYSIVQPGAFAYGIQHSNPVDTSVAYAGKFEQFGTKKDPMVGKRLGGVNVFGGGLGLYNSKKELVGGIGVSGDSSCADHLLAWRLRHALGLDHVPAGPSANKDDQMILDIANGKSKSGYGQPACGGREKELLKTLPKVPRTL